MPIKMSQSLVQDVMANRVNRAMAINAEVKTFMTLSSYDITSEVPVTENPQSVKGCHKAEVRSPLTLVSQQRLSHFCIATKLNKKDGVVHVNLLGPCSMCKVHHCSGVAIFFKARVDFHCKWITSPIPSHKHSCDLQALMHTPQEQFMFPENPRHAFSDDTCSDTEAAARLCS